MQDARIIAMEETIAHQSQQIEELSAEIAKQWKMIDRLSRNLEMLSEHYQDLEDQLSGPPSATKPPHY